MTARPRDGIVAIAIALFLLGGVALDTWGPKVAPARPPAAAEPEFDARAVFCPPALRRPASRVTVTATARGNEPVDVSFAPWSDERVGLAPGSTLELVPPGAEPAEPADAVDVVGYGGRVDATVVTSVDEPVSGVGGAACAPAAATRWYFPEGNSTVTHDERLLIYNPFPDEAVVRVALLTPGGERTKAGLSDVAVPSESSIALAINDFVFEQKVLGAIVTAVRGRVVAWRLSIARPEEKPSGVEFTLGASSLRDTWYFPEGAVGAGFEERISVMNPGNTEATVEITLVTDSKALPAAGATEVPVPARSTVAIVLDESALPGERGGAGAIVRSVNRVPVVVERTVFYATEEFDGVASEIGSSRPSKRWLLGPATSRPGTDSAVLLNATGQDVRVTLTLIGAEGRPLRPRSLANLTLAAGARLRVPLGELTDGEPYAVLVEATGKVVAERFSYSAGAGDVSSLMGTPLE
ncbi:MAG: DUF5719 family protein [Actinomycetota bacterium]|nr:DUF5719 family protein [Actinomycetota bacterium]